LLMPSSASPSNFSSRLSCSTASSSSCSPMWSGTWANCCR
jgi:hypothetical protein